MTREEEIQHKAGSISDAMIAHNVSHNECKGYYEGYIDGAKYADSIFIDKVEKYLRNNIILYTYATTLYQREEWFNNFRKAMKE